MNNWEAQDEPEHLRTIRPSEDPPSKGFYGSRVFAFTDDLDVTNRLFHNLLDAEGRDSWGRPLPRRQPLAALRSPLMVEKG
ncbi:hypothetical protein [Mastigocladopsis repens]|uniref:hypothetical protein n=1 Tax=Mastigocladopsis repens TaxID=221287 RepID=UPI0018DD5124|nr:hypothetical protein [Mastigocladopsis repens]